MSMQTIQTKQTNVINKGLLDVSMDNFRRLANIMDITMSEAKRKRSNEMISFWDRGEFNASKTQMRPHLV